MKVRFVRLATLALSVSTSVWATNSLGLKEYAGYPTCQSVLEHREKANLEAIRAGLSAELLARFDEMGHTFPPAKFYEESKKYSDDHKGHINKLSRTDRRVAGPFFGGSCFSGETLVTAIKVNSDSIVNIPISKVDTDYFVLSSTAEIFSNDPQSEHVMDCWDKVNGYIESNSGDRKYETITYHTGPGTKPVSLKVMDGHRFYCKDSGNGKCEWTKAEDVKKDGILFNGEGNVCTVQSRTIGSSYTSLVPFSSKTFTVYNLQMVHTKNYYVGPTDQRVLVHNVK